MSDEKKDPNSILMNIYREVGETKTFVKSLDSKLEKHIEYSSEEFNKINNLDMEQNRSLDRHIEGVNTLKELYIAHRVESIEQIQLLKDSLEVQKKDSENNNKLIEARLQSLEKPGTLIKYAGKVLVWVGTVLAALVSIIKLMGL